MVRLAIDTTSGFVQIALDLRGKIFVKKSDHDNAQAEEVAVLLQGLLKESGVSMREVEEVFCLVGPGSFTGLRVGVAFVKGLVLGSDIKVVPVTNFHFYLANYLIEFKVYENADVLINCGKNKEEFFCQTISSKFSNTKKAKIISYDQVTKFKSKNLVLGDFDKLIAQPDENFFASQYKSLNIENIFKLPDLSDEYTFEPLYIRPTYVT